VSLATPGVRRQEHVHGTGAAVDNHL
jgi:hypothetical protein